MWSIPSSIRIVLLTIKQEIAKTIKNGLPFIFLPALRTMRMSTYHGVSSIVNEITIASNGFRKRDVYIFNAIMWEDDQIIHHFLSIHDNMVYFQIIDISTAIAFMLTDIIKNAETSGKAQC